MALPLRSRRIGCALRPQIIRSVHEEERDSRLVDKTVQSFVRAAVNDLFEEIKAARSVGTAA
jgi:hypothetical protein